MKQRSALLLPALMFLLPGCFIRHDTVYVPVEKEKKHRKHSECHPSEYWDGHHCKHKGKGKGSRKHDH